MHDRAAELIRELRLEPHPEGGYFREVFRSPQKVKPLDERPERSALTTIHFLLLKGQHSRWHRVASDEAWHFYEGDPLVVHWIDDGAACMKRCLRAGQQTVVRFVWSPRNAGKRRNRAVNIVWWDARSARDLISAISR